MRPVPGPGKIGQQAIEAGKKDMEKRKIDTKQEQYLLLKKNKNGCYE